MSRDTPGGRKENPSGREAGKHRRRTILGALATGALAGCLGDGGEDETPTGGGPEGGFTDTPTVSPTPTSTAVPTPDPGDVDPGAVSSIAELVAISGQDDLSVRMEPGVYEVADYFNDARIREKRANQDWPFIVFAGNGCEYDFTDVTFEFDTSIREKLGAPYTNKPEFLISGNDNQFTGLEIVNRGDGTSHGGQVLEARGDGNTVDDFRLVVRGSSPYGYGDLLGKGHTGVGDVRLEKHSGFRITGNNTTVTNTTIKMRSFGHGFFFQKGATNTLLKNCNAEGEMRSTTEMLNDTSGPAYENDFESHWPTKNDEGKIPPGYMKSLAEDGFRTYDAETVTLKNCTAQNMRGGFGLGSKGGIHLENCAAIGCERGMFITSEATIRGTRVDARYGPAMIFDGDNISAEITLGAERSEFTVPATGMLMGSDNELRISKDPDADSGWTQLPPIKLGFERTPANNMYSPTWGTAPAENYELLNETTTPVWLSEDVTGSRVFSAGNVEEGGSQNEVRENFEHFDKL